MISYFVSYEAMKFKPFYRHAASKYLSNHPVTFGDIYITKQKILANRNIVPNNKQSVLHVSTSGSGLPLVVRYVNLSTSESIWGGVYMPHKMDTQGHSAIFRATNSQAVLVHSLQRQYTYISLSMQEPDMRLARGHLSHTLSQID